MLIQDFKAGRSSACSFILIFFSQCCPEFVLLVLTTSILHDLYLTMTQLILKKYFGFARLLHWIHWILRPNKELYLSCLVELYQHAC